MKTVFVKKSMWHTQGGRTQHTSQLRSSQSKRLCCLGFAAQQAGCKGITDVAEPEQLPSREYKKFQATYPRLTPIVMNQLIDENDSKESTRVEKMRRITDIGSKAGVNFQFI